MVVAPARDTDATPAPERQPDGSFRFTLPAGGFVRLHGDVVLAEARCIGQ